MKENRTFRSYSFYHQKTIISRQAWQEFFLKPQYKCEKEPKSSISLFPFLLPLLFQGYRNPQVRIRKKKLTALINNLVHQDQPQGYILSYFYKLLRTSSLSRMLEEFSLKLVYSTMVGKSFKSMVFTFIENALNLDIFTHTYFPFHSKLSLSSYHHTLSRGKLLILPCSIFY